MRPHTKFKGENKMTLFGGVIPVTAVSFLMLSVMAIATVGYALGRITIKGISLGTAGVFLAAILYGCFFFKNLDAQLTIKIDEQAVSYASNALKTIENMGLILFVTSVGFIAGPKFFGNMKKNFKSYVLLGFIIILVGGIAAVGCIFFGRAIGGETDTNEFTAMVTGLLSGALTSTPAFSATKAAVAEQYEAAVSVGYGIAYIFGVVGVVLFVQLMPKFTHADMDAERAKLTAVDDGSRKKQYAGRLIDMDGFGIMPFALAAVIGIIIGSIKIPLTGKGLSGTAFSLTTTGGCLLTALVFGHFGRIGNISIMPKVRTLKVFRELGLMLFLIGAGVSGGASFVKYFKVVYFFYGVIMTTLPMIIGYIFAKYVLKMNLLNILGSITGGMTSTPALGTLIGVSGTEDVAAAYAATYPIALIVVVLVSQFLVILF